MDILKIKVNVIPSGDPTVDQQLEVKAQEFLAEATKVGLEACKATVPFNRGELRNDIVPSIAGGEGTISVADVAYIGGRGSYGKSGRRDSASTVAKILDEGYAKGGGMLNRRNTSVPAFDIFNTVPGFTAGWVDLAGDRAEKVIDENAGI